jgi:hypothetical protein
MPSVDEELNILEESLRRLKIEYDVYFGGGSKKPPVDTEWRVQNLIKKYQEGGRMTYPQRFRYNTITQRYALFADLWRKKLKIKEEGYRRPQDAVLGIQGMRAEEEQEAREALAGEAPDKPFSSSVSDANADHERVKALYDAMVKAKQGGGGVPNFDQFKSFVAKKTEQIRKEYGCHSVEYSVDAEGKLKAKAKV